jgi:hypothetical protein
VSEDFEGGAFPLLTRTIKVGNDSLTVRSNTGTGLADGLKQAAEVAGDMAEAEGLIKTAFGISQAAVSAEVLPAGDEVKTRQGRTYGRTVKPGAAKSGGKECSHGKEWKDLLGGTTKNGQPYKYRFYNTCGNQECKPWGDQG